MSEIVVMTSLSLTCFYLLSCVMLLDGLRTPAKKVTYTDCYRPNPVEQRVYDFTVPDIMEDRNVSLNEYRNKVLLIVNVASYCTLVWHYHQLNALKTKFGAMGFDVLGFPCNQFKLQEPGHNGTEIMNGITYVSPGNGFVPNFPMFTKIEVNGEEAHPLYTFLKSSCPPTREEYNVQTELFYTPIRVNDVRWNYEKYLIDRKGFPVKRYDPKTPPNDITSDIEELLFF